MKEKQLRILENIFDIICKTRFENKARTELERDTKKFNISFNNDKQTITFESLKNSQRILYTLEIRKGV